MGFTYSEAYRIPIWQRRWFVERIKKEFKNAREADATASRAAHDNDPQSRALQGRRPDTPAKLRRFT